MMRFGIRLKELRKRNEITQDELGKVLNISGRVIGYYENGIRFPKNETILMFPLFTFWGTMSRYISLI